MGAFAYSHNRWSIISIISSDYSFWWCYTLLSKRETLLSLRSVVRVSEPYTVRLSDRRRDMIGCFLE
jgi:hypothetical protein